MAIFCSYCGSECGEREQANGRCGSCACFFTGNEEVVAEDAVGDVPVEPKEREDSPFAVVAPPPEAEPKPEPVQEVDPNEPSTTTSAEQGMPNTSFDPGEVEPVGPMPEISESEGLIQPRRLSPQFKRRVEMTWESTYGGASSMPTAESTLSSHSPSSKTKSANKTLSIATRKVTKASGTRARKAGESDYELKDVIGEGSMGRVWSARQNSLDRDVAVKVPMSELIGEGSVGESQFISEVVVTGQLEHPNIVPIYELGRDATGVPFYSMKHVRGKPWNEFIEEKGEVENLEILMKVCDAVAFAHDRNFLHRDIKPHNVMVGEFGEVSVMDWGIAVAITKDPDKPWASIATGPAGTPAYMAPEMAAHNPSELGVVSDVYLLGAVLYEIVTGTPPHPKTGDTSEALLAAAANEISPTTKTGELVDISRRAMATKLEDRFQSVKELQDAIREYQTHRESIKLSDSAEVHYANGKEQRSSDEYARARFAYEESLKLWDGNDSAKQGLKLATIDHAKNALDQENFELGISILDANDPSHRDLLNQLESKRLARQKLAQRSKVLARTAAIAIFAVVGITLYAYIDSEHQRTLLKESEEGLKIQAVELQKERDYAEDQKDIAVDATSRAVDARDAALRAQREARRLESEARTEKRRAEEAPYSSEISLAAESLRANLIGKAEQILDKLDPTQPKSNGVMSELRHIEWGLLKRKSSPPAISDLAATVRAVAVDSSIDGMLRAAASVEGKVLVWHSNGSGPIDDRGEPDAAIELEFGEKVNAIAVSQDGRFIAAGGIRRSSDVDSNERADYSAAVWEVDDQGNVAEPDWYSGHEEEVLSIQFSRDAERVLTSSGDRRAIVWDRKSKGRVSAMTDHLDEKVWCARFSPDDRSVVTACEDGRVRVWEVADENGDLPEAKKRFDFRGHDGPVYAAIFSVDGRSVISGGFDRKLLRWDLSLELSRDQSKDREAIRARLEGKVIGSRDVTELDEIGGAASRHSASIQTISVAEIAGKRYLLSGGNDNTIRVWKDEGRGWQLEKVLSGHGRLVRSCAFSDSGNAIVSGAYDGVKWWRWQDYEMPNELIPNTENRISRQPSELGLPSALRSVYSRDGRWVATVYGNGTVEVWNLNNPERATGEMLVEGHAMLAANAKFYDAGRQMMTSAGDNTTRLWNVGRGTHQHKLVGTGYRGVADVSWNEATQSGLVVTGSDQRLFPARIWRINSHSEPVQEPLMKEYARRRFRQEADRVSFRIDGDFASPAIDSLGDLKKWKRIRRRVPDVTAIVFSPLGDRLLIGDSMGGSILFSVDPETQDVDMISEWPAHHASVKDAAFLEDGRRLLTASVDGDVVLWDAENAEPVTALPLSGPVTSVSASAERNQVLIGRAPQAGVESAIAELYELRGDELHLVAKLEAENQRRSRDWTGNPPTVRSIRFADDANQALVSLFFPDGLNQSTNLSKRRGTGSSYVVGYWNWESTVADFQPISLKNAGEISAAIPGSGAASGGLLVVGGKGARFFSADGQADGQAGGRSLELTQSFRPPSSIRTVDFSFDPSSQRSERLVVGDSDGNVRIWELDGDSWSENVAAASHLVGAHRDMIVSTQFDPTDPRHLLTADRSGNWKRWRYQTEWQVSEESQSDDELNGLNVALFSPQGRRVLFGTESSGFIFRLSDQDRLQRVAENWNPRRVRTGIFSDDGSWIVTSDADRTVTFWDASGNPLAKMQEEDASGTTAFTLSYDRRRMITAQGKRIVVWDTSPMLDVDDIQQDQDGAGDEMIKELFSLPSVSDVTSIDISPNGRHVLASTMNGKTRIWEGEIIAPITFSFPDNLYNVPENSGEKHIGSSAFLSDPSRAMDFGGAKVTIHIEGEPVEGEQLMLVPTTDAVGAAISIENRGGEDVVSLRNYFGAEPTKIGTLRTFGTNGASLSVELEPGVDARGLQSLLRTVTYRVDSSDAKNVSSDDNVDEVVEEEVSVRTRIVTVSISGFRFHDASLPAPTEPLQQQIVIEVEPESIETNLPLTMARNRQIADRQ